MIKYLVTFTLLAGISLTGAESPLKPGDALPVIQGTTLNEKPLQLPQAAAGRSAVLAFGFSKDAGVPVREWVKRLGDSAALYQVPVLEGVPRLFRGLTVGGIRKDTEPKLRDNVVLIYKDDAAWRARLQVSDDKTAYLVVVDSQGRILERFAGAPTDDNLARVRSALAKASGGDGK
jgi:hypothetical protein